MKKNNKLIIAVTLLASFVVWTILLKVVDVKGIGPLGTEVGFTSLNKILYNWIDFNEILFNITDWLMYSVIAAAAVFGIIGLVQWIKRKSFLKVDHQILLLGLAYIIVIVAYFIFDKLLIINCRPVLIGTAEAPEPSYPSSHTMTALFVFLSAIPMVKYLLANKKGLKTTIIVVLVALATFTVFGRIFSGAHWFSDIVGGALFAIGLFYLWMYFVDLVNEKKNIIYEGNSSNHDERN